jgi:1,4-alpha-glucan branching enzyme
VGVQKLVGDLNGLYRRSNALYYYDFEPRGFSWIDCHDAAQSVISYIRHYEDEEVLIVLNFTPVVRQNYRIGVTQTGVYKEIFNSDSQYYGGSNVGNGEVQTDTISWMGQPYSINLTLPPLAGIVLQRQSKELKDEMNVVQETAETQISKVEPTTEG